MKEKEEIEEVIMVVGVERTEEKKDYLYKGLAEVEKSIEKEMNLIKKEGTGIGMGVNEEEKAVLR